MFMMFGDVGGFYDFLIILFAPIFGYFARNFMAASMIQKLFHAAMDNAAPNRTPEESLAAIRPITFSRAFTLF